MAGAVIKEFPRKSGKAAPKNVREHILQVAEELIVQYGSNGFSYQHIADRVGIRKASIHHHFPTKNDLILVLGQMKADAFFAQMNSIMVGKGSAAEKLELYFSLFEENFIRGCGASISFFGMLGAEFGSQDDRVADRVRQFFSENISRLTALIEEGRKEGSLHFPGEPELTAVAIFSMLEGAMIIVRASGDWERYGEIIAEVRRLIVSP